MFSARWRGGSFNNKWRRPCEDLVFLGCTCGHLGNIFGVEYLILATKTKMPGKKVFFKVFVWLFWGTDGAPDGWEK